jgi:hypothetical protein
MNPGESSGVPIIKELLSHIADSKGYVFLDCPPGSSCAVMESIKDVDYCVLVAEPTIFGLHNLKMVHELVNIFHKPFGIVLNKCTDDENPSEEQINKFSLSCERANMYKNYYTYLYGLPMKLKDKGTIIHQKVTKTKFKGKDYLVLKATYKKEVGKDTWYFYFDPTTYAMKGYRFYHDESKNDGEYILLEDETVFENVRLPQKRTWYTHKEDKLLGTDILAELSF